MKYVCLFFLADEFLTIFDRSIGIRKKGCAEQKKMIS